MLLWIDGFDHYGGDVARLRDGVYAQVQGVELTNVGARTGARCAYITPSVNDSGMRRVLPSTVPVVGLGFAFNLNNLPTDSTSVALCQILDENNAPAATLTVMPTGAIQLRAGGRTSTVITQSAAEVVATGSFQHFECEFGAGTCEVRINGVTVLNTATSGVVLGFAQVMVGGCNGFPKSGAGLVRMHLDDAFCRDGSGALNNSWIGDQKVYTRLPDEDGAEQDWTPSTGSTAWEILDNVPPIDAQYINATAAGERTSVGFGAFPTEIVAISGVYTASRIWKSDAGNAKVTVDMISGASETAQADHPLSTAPRWYGDMFETNPATSLPWLVTDINAAQAVLERIE